MIKKKRIQRTQKIKKRAKICLKKGKSCYNHKIIMGNFLYTYGRSSPFKEYPTLTKNSLLVPSSLTKYTMFSPMRVKKRCISIFYMYIMK
jgi:hypothetical protein